MCPYPSFHFIEETLMHLRRTPKHENVILAPPFRKGRLGGFMDSRLKHAGMTKGDMRE